MNRKSLLASTPAEAPRNAMHWVPYGPNAMLIRFAEQVGDDAFQRSCAMVQELERKPPAGLLEFVPAFTTLLLEFDPASAPDIAKVAEELLPRLERAATATLHPATPTEIPVIYDGEDLENVARIHDMPTDAVIALHAAPIYKVYMLGFAPGFPYLGDLDARLHTPRLANPRPRVRAGSVSIGGEHTGIYSIDGPGGWNIIGHTPVKLFDPTAVRPFYLRMGDRVKFVAA